MKKMLVFAAAALIGLPSMAAAQIVGHCSDCHTMHNSEQGQPVAMATTNGQTTLATNGNENLLKLDCIACHAQDDGMIVELPGLSQVPQVYHQAGVDAVQGDAAALFSANLAAGNFRFIDAMGGSDRKGHNVSDLFSAGDATYDRPPGFHKHNIHDNVFGDASQNFTCAGVAGCHGTRFQQTAAGEARVGMAAISGAHHLSMDGLKDPAQNTDGVHSGEQVAAGYRFIPGLKGKGSTERWQNLNAGTHNEYYGVSGASIAMDGNQNCQHCHAGFDDTTRKMRVPNQSMSGFCATCHSVFHSSGSATDPNQTSGAFLRHPSDFTIPNEREYALYTAYDVSALVARPDLVAGTFTPGEVRPGTDVVMCLSCHMAHGSPYDGMLRFNYGEVVSGAANYTAHEDSQMSAGNSTAVGTGCLACHALKGYAGSVAP